MTRSNEEIWSERGDRWGGRFTRHPVGWGLLTLAAIMAAVLLFGFLIGWFNAARDIVSPANVKAQYHAVITDWNALEVAAENACGAADAQGSQQGATLLEDPAFAFQAQYRHITVDYNERQNNLFEAEAVGPSGYPRNAPTLERMEARLCR